MPERWRDGLTDEQLAADKDAEYRKLHGIGPTQTYYHAEQRMWRPDYLITILVEK